MEFVIVFLIVFIIYGAGWIWQTVSDLMREPGRPPGAAPVLPAARRWGVDLSDLRRTFARVAEERSGRVLSPAPFELPRVGWVFRASQAVLSAVEAGDEGRRLATQITYSMPPGWRIRIEAFPQRLGADNPGLVALEDLEVGDPEFDPRFVVKSSDAEFPRQFFDRTTRRVVEDLRALGGTDQVLVSANSSRLMVRKPGVLPGSAELQLFTELTGQIFDRLMVFWQKQSGIELMDEPEDPAAEIRCQICGTPIPGENRVNCRKCRTPHHEDCWTFNEGCATYACGEKRFVKK